VITDENEITNEIADENIDGQNRRWMQMKSQMDVGEGKRGEGCFHREEEDERCGREKKEIEKTCVVGRGKREKKKVIFVKKVKVKSIILMILGIVKGSYCGVNLYKEAKSSLDP
jgi:hypothetical protein